MKKNKRHRVLVLFVEGDTEVEFYKCLFSTLRHQSGDVPFNIQFEVVNVKGVGKFKSIALRKFEKQIKIKYEKETEYTVAFCRDTDVFELQGKPPVYWNDVEKSFSQSGVKKIIHVCAKQSIEDWFLYDLEGIRKYLKIPKKTKTSLSGKNGNEKLSNLFKVSNKVYVKGEGCKEMIQNLDIGKIISHIRGQLSPLYQVLGIK